MNKLDNKQNHLKVSCLYKNTEMSRIQLLESHDQKPLDGY